MEYSIRSLKTMVLSFKVQVLLVLIEISMTTQLRLNCNIALINEMLYSS